MEVDWSDTIGGRLERLYHQVLDLVNVHKRQRRKCFVDNTGKMKRFLAIASEKSPRLLRRVNSIEDAEDAEEDPRHQQFKPTREVKCVLGTIYRVGSQDSALCRWSSSQIAWSEHIKAIIYLWLILNPQTTTSQ